MDLEFIREYLYKHPPLTQYQIKETLEITGHHPHEFYDRRPYVSSFSSRLVNEVMGFDDIDIPYFPHWCQWWGFKGARFVADLPMFIRPIWLTEGKLPSESGVF